jgi:hypothetical protein
VNTNVLNISKEKIQGDTGLVDDLARILVLALLFTAQIRKCN